MADSFDFHSSAMEMCTLMQYSHKSSFSKQVKGMVMGELGLLNFLSMQDEPITAGAIGRMIGIGSSGVTNLLNSLEKKGLVIRRMSPNDRRSVLVSLSDKGREDIEIRKAKMLDFTEAMLTRLGEEDTRTLLRLLKRTNQIGEELFNELQCREGEPS